VTGLDLAGHVAYAAILAGLLLIGRGQRVPGLARWGWSLRIAGELGWVAIGVALLTQGIALTSIVIWGLVFVVADILGLVQAHRLGDLDSAP